MKYVIFLLFAILSNISTQTNAYLYGNPAYVSARECKTGSDTESHCSMEECHSNEAWISATCVLVVCAGTANPIQNGIFCSPPPPCNLQNDEYRAQSGECIPCPYPGVFFNDVCHACHQGNGYTDSQHFSYDEERCVNNSCADGYEPFNTMCVRSCTQGYEHDIFGNCVRQIPTCAPNQTLNGYECLDNPPPEEEEEPEECETLIGSITCLKNDIVQKFNSFFQVGNELDRILNTLNTTSDHLDNVQNNNGTGTGGNNQEEQEESGDTDTSEMDAETPFEDLSNMALDETLFPNDPTCPNNRTLNIWAYQYEFSFEKICSALDKLSYLVLAICFAIAASIILRE
jgi:hypothetical protein